MHFPFAWPGGKRALAKTLLSLLPAHEIYVEPFAGSAKLLFSKPASAFEVLNDLNGDITNFFRVAKHRPSELAERFALECIHAGRFRDLRVGFLAGTQPECELDRALRFAYLSWFSFGGKGQHFASARAAQGVVHRPLTRVRTLLQAVAARLACVQIEQRDFAEILDRYDTPQTLFYLDPPYCRFGANGRYEALTTERRAALFTALAAIQRRFLMSFDDCPEIRERAAAHRFEVMPVTVTYTLAGARENTRPKARELLLANYPLITKDQVTEV